MSFNITFASPYFELDTTTISLTGDFDVPVNISYNGGELNSYIDSSGDANISSDKNLYLQPGEGYTAFIVGGNNPGETGGDVHLVPGSGSTKGAVKMYHYDGNDLYLAFSVGTGIGFWGTENVSKQTVSGSKGGNAALASLITALANYGLITDSTS